MFLRHGNLTSILYNHSYTTPTNINYSIFMASRLFCSRNSEIYSYFLKHYGLEFLEEVLPYQKKRRNIFYTHIFKVVDIKKASKVKKLKGYPLNSKIRIRVVNSPRAFSTLVHTGLEGNSNFICNLHLDKQLEADFNLTATLRHVLEVGCKTSSWDTNLQVKAKIQELYASLFVRIFTNKDALNNFYVWVRNSIGDMNYCKYNRKLVLYSSYTATTTPRLVKNNIQMQLGEDFQFRFQPNTNNIGCNWRCEVALVRHRVFS